MARHITNEFSLLKQEIATLKEQKAHLDGVLKDIFTVKGQEPKTRESIEVTKQRIMKMIERMTDYKSSL